MRSLRLSCLATTALFSAALSTTAYSQVDDEIVVTGLRQAYQGDFTPLEVPNAIQVIDSQLLSDAGALNLSEALDLSASVARQNNFGGLWNSFSVRGFSGDINLPSGFLVNGFNAGRGFGGPRDLVGVESVDVLKGPRSALFGRGEPGGTINLVTKRPKFETGGYVQGTVGSWNQFRVEGDAQTVLGSDETAGVRLVGFFEDAESFRDGVETQKIGFYPSVTVNVSDVARVTYELEYTQQENPFDRGVIFSEDFGFSPRDVFVGESTLIETEVLGHQLEAEYDLSDNWSFLAGVGYRETTLEGDAFEPQFGSRQTFFDDGQTVSRFFRSRDFDSDYLALRGEFSGDFETGSLRHRLIIGADYDEFDNSLVIDRYRTRFSGDLDNLSADEIAVNLLLDVNNPIYGANLNPVASPNTDRNEVLKGVGIYIQDQIDLTDNLQIRIGGRFDDFEQDITNFLATPNTTQTSADTRFSPQFGAVYSVNDGISLYASYGEGFRQQSGVDFQGDQFAPNLTKSKELGFKADLSRLFETVEGSASFTLFEVDQSNILVNDDRPEAQFGFFSIPAGEARSRGVELDANAEFGNDVRVWVSYAYTDAQFTNSNPDADFGAVIEAGDQLINSPKHQLNIQLSKGFELGNIPAEIGGGLLHVGERVGWTGFDFFLPEYTTFRAFASIEPVENIALRLNVENLFDDTFYSNSFADVWVQPGAPRRVRFTAAYKF